MPRKKPESAYFLKQFSRLPLVVDALRDLIARGEWKETLPGEHTLSARLQIGRPMLRSALQALSREGVVEISKGKRTRILKRNPRPSRRPETVVVVASNAFHELSEWHMLTLLELQSKLHLAGYSLRVHGVGPYQNISRLKHSLETLFRETPSACWVLLTGFVEVHRFFEAKAKDAPVLIARVPPPRSPFPRFFIDNGPACRHAAFRLLSLGHRRIALLIPKPPTAHFERQRKSFLQAFESSDARDSTPCIINHTEDWPDISAKLDRLFRNKASRPTAMVVVNSTPTLQTLAFCHTHGIQLPRDLSLISIGHTRFLDNWHPLISCYKADVKRYASTFCRLILQLLRDGSLPVSRHCILPEYFEGETVASWKGN